MKDFTDSTGIITGGASGIGLAMADGTFHVFTHPDFWQMVEERLGRVRADYRKLL